MGSGIAKHSCCVVHISSSRKAVLMRAINLLVCSALLLTVLLGCGSGNQMGSFPQPSVPVAGKIFVANGSSNTILRFGMGDNGNVNPGARITSTALHAPIALLSDTANDRLYVFSLADADILVFNNVSTRNGSTVPDRL